MIKIPFVKRLNKYSPELNLGDSFVVIDLYDFDMTKLSHID